MHFTHLFIILLSFLNLLPISMAQAPVQAAQYNLAKPSSSAWECKALCFTVSEDRDESEDTLSSEAQSADQKSPSTEASITESPSLTFNRIITTPLFYQKEKAFDALTRDCGDQGIALIRKFKGLSNHTVHDRLEDDHDDDDAFLSKLFLSSSVKLQTKKSSRHQTHYQVIDPSLRVIFEVLPASQDNACFSKLLWSKPIHTLPSGDLIQG